ncbi:MAG TPA: hypothetical protein VMX56_04420 [Anaerolineales bacterium]|nr:hypothetical protein [Anaerolineales bacterium]
MLGILADIKQFIATVMSLGSWLILGAALAFFGALFRPWVGFSGVAAGGAAIMFLAITGHWLGDDSKKLEQLEAELRGANIALAIASAERELVEKHLKKEKAVTESNAAVISRLNEKISAQSERPDCTIPGDLFNDLDKLR